MEQGPVTPSSADGHAELKKRLTEIQQEKKSLPVPGFEPMNFWLSDVVLFLSQTFIGEILHLSTRLCCSSPD